MRREFSWRDYDKFEEWLQDVLETMVEDLKNKDKEIEGLNNIINELEKWLKEEMKELNTDIYVEYQFILNKIKELKGEDKE